MTNRLTNRPQPRPFDRAFKLVLSEADPVFRAGLVTGLSRFPDLQIVLELGLTPADRPLLQERLNAAELPDVLLLGWERDRQPSQSVALQLCQQVRSRHPVLPILLLGVADPTSLAAARQAGATGFWGKGGELTELVAALRQVAAGQSYWPQSAPAIAQEIAPSLTPWSLLKQNLRRSGVQQIEATIAELEAQLRNPHLSSLDQIVLAGRRRELRSARWLLNQMLGSAPETRSQPIVPPPIVPILIAPSRRSNSALSVPNPLATVRVDSSAPRLTPPPASVRSLQVALFDSLAARLQSSLRNGMETPLEIDILKEEKKRELLYTILRKLEETLDELRFSQVQAEQLAGQRSRILQDLWQAVLSDFFGKYYTLHLPDRSVAVIELLQQDFAIVETAILNKIPLIPEVLTHLLFLSPLTIDDASYEAGTVEAMARVEILLQNLLIQMANAVMQPLLNQLGDVAEIKQSFYDKRLLPSREVERFRNQLSWKYRVEQWLGEPQAIFESRFNLLVIHEPGIIKTCIYAPRNSELAELAGVQYAVTLALEARDAIAPRLRAAVSFVGSGLVYVLTEVLGRGLGLIGRGVIKGIGSALQDAKSTRSSDR